MKKLFILMVVSMIAFSSCQKKHIYHCVTEVNGHETYYNASQEMTERQMNKFVKENTDESTKTKTICDLQ